MSLVTANMIDVTSVEGPCPVVFMPNHLVALCSACGNVLLLRYTCYLVEEDLVTWARHRQNQQAGRVVCGVCHTPAMAADYPRVHKTPALLASDLDTPQSRILDLLRRHLGIKRKIGWRELQAMLPHAISRRPLSAASVIEAIEKPGVRRVRLIEGPADESGPMKTRSGRIYGGEVT